MYLNVDYQKERDPAPRYELIRPVLERFQRPYSMIDVGANAGYFCVRAVEETQCFPIAIEKEAGLCDRRIPCIESRVSASDLYELSISEHFDVVLALSVLHHVDQWQDFLTALLNLGTHVIVEYPNMDEELCRHVERAHEQAIVLNSLCRRTVLGTTQPFEGPGTRTVALYEQPKAYVCTGAFYDRMKRRVPHTTKHHDVAYDHSSKRVHGRSWIHGINLWSFLQMGGGNPSREAIVHGLPYVPGHGDIRPWNYILNHQGTTLFDPAPPGVRYHPDDAAAFAEMRRWILEGGDIG